ncbi:MAG: DUF1573 domain-containing protein [Acidobacteriota bacterium]
MNRVICAAALVVLAACGGSPSAPTGRDSRGISLAGNLAFGSVVVGRVVTSTLTITNTGTAALVVSGLTGPAGVIANWASGTIPAGGAQVVTVAFVPVLAGQYGGDITVIANQTSGTNTIATSGTAVPNMNGVWTGTQTVSSFGASGTCNMVWIASGQIDATFSGTWQTSGSGCGQAGTFSGTVSSAGGISALTFGAVVGNINCTRIAGDDFYTGLISGTTATVQTSETIRCQGIGDVPRASTLSLTKQ